MRLGLGFTGSSEVLTSDSADYEIIPVPSAEIQDQFKIKKYGFYKFSFKNINEVAISINHGDYFYLEACEGIVSDESDALIYSLRIKDAGVNFHWHGAF